MHVSAVSLIQARIVRWPLHLLWETATEKRTSCKKDSAQNRIIFLEIYSSISGKQGDGFFPEKGD